MSELGALTIAVTGLGAVLWYWALGYWLSGPWTREDS